MSVERCHAGMVYLCNKKGKCSPARVFVAG